jgi:hypothetical protein
MKLRSSRVKYEQYGLDSTGSTGGPVTSYYSQDEAHSGPIRGEKVLECLANLYVFEDFYVFAPGIAIKLCNTNQRNAHFSN